MAAMNHDIKSSDVFLKSDITAIARALLLSARVLVQGNPTEHTRGFVDGVKAVADALNIDIETELRL